MIADDDELKRAQRAMERPGDRATREQDERDTAALIRKALEPRCGAESSARPAVKLDLDVIERNAKAWPRANIQIAPPLVLALVAIARAAEAFVDEQGKRVDGQYGLADAGGFALDQWRDLVAALEAAGR